MCTATDPSHSGSVWLRKNAHTERFTSPKHNIKKPLNNTQNRVTPSSKTGAVMKGLSCPTTTAVHCHTCSVPDKKPKHAISLILFPDSCCVPTSGRAYIQATFEECFFHFCPHFFLFREKYKKKYGTYGNLTGCQKNGTALKLFFSSHYYGLIWKSRSKKRGKKTIKLASISTQPLPLRTRVAICKAYRIATLACSCDRTACDHH